jgi:hypothetical protein
MTRDGPATFIAKYWRQEIAFKHVSQYRILYWEVIEIAQIPKRFWEFRSVYSDSREMMRAK